MAAQWGYGIPPGWAEMLSIGINPDLDLSTHERLLLFGHDDPWTEDQPLPEDSNGDPLPADGCYGEADRTLSGGLPEPDFTVAYSNSHALARADRRVSAAEEAWRDCMTRAGYEYESSTAPHGRTDWRPGEETTAALIDVDCKVETNLVGVWMWVETRYQQRYIEANWDALQRVKQWRDAVYENAAQLLAETGNPAD
jgi:hypothetical protein